MRKYMKIMQTLKNSMKNILIKSSIPVVMWCMMSFLCCGNLLAQEQLNLEEVKEAALSYSNDIKNGKIRIEQAEAAKQEAIANYFPQISATGVGLYGFEDFLPPIPEVLPDGINNFYQVGATATEVVYAGGRIRRANALVSLQTQTRTIQAEQATDSVIVNTEQKYWQLVQVQEQLKAIGASKMYLDELLKQQQDLLSAGLISKNQLLQVKSNRSRVLLQQSKLGNQRKLALLDLGLYVGKIYDTTAVAADTLKQVTPPGLKYHGPDLDLQNNNNYKLLEKSITASQLQTKITKADLLPQVSVGINAGYFGTFNNTIDSKFMPVAFGMVTIPISDWWGAGHYKIKQKALQEKMVQNNFEDLKDELTIGIMKSWYDLMDAYKQINYAKDNLDYAYENLKVERDNYNSGLNNLTDLLNAQQQKESAETEYANAYATFRIAESKYLFVTDNL